MSRLTDGRPIPFVSASRITSEKHSDKQTGFFYLAAKQMKYRRIVARFEREEREIENELQRQRDVLAQRQVLGSVGG